MRVQSLWACVVAAAVANWAGPVRGLVIEHFENDGPGSFPGAWYDIDNAHSPSPRVRHDANGINGHHLEFSSPFFGDTANGFETIGMMLPVGLRHDGDYLQVAVQLPSGGDQIGAWLMLNGEPFSGGSHVPAASIGLESLHAQFSHASASAHGAGDFGAVALDTWYYLRATIRDAGGMAGAIDSFDFQIFSDAAGTNLVAQKTGISFAGGEGNITDIALRTFPQSGSPVGVALFDEITTNVELPPPFVRPADYGRQWVRDNPFNVFAWGSGGDIHDPLFAQLSFSGVEVRDGYFYQAGEADREGMNWYAYLEELYTGPPLTAEIQRKINRFVLQGGPAGSILISDEPPIETMPSLGVVADWIRANHPRMMIFATVGYGPTSEYVDEMMATIRPDVLLYDIYPVLKGQAFDMDYHFEYLMFIRAKAAQYDVPAYAWLQSFEDTLRRLPSESELRLLAYSYLAAGYKGLGYYRYTSASPDTISNALVDLNGQPSELFDSAAGLNPEIHRLGKVLRFLESTDVRFIAGQYLRFGFLATTNDTPTGLQDWTPGAGGDPRLVSATVQPGQYGQHKNGLIGFFEDDLGRNYFMLVNLFQGAGLNADNAALQFVLQFDASVDQLWRLNRLTGEIEMVPLVGHTLVWTLPGGTGDLFAWHPDFIPEPRTAGIVGIILTVSACFHGIVRGYGPASP